MRLRGRIRGQVGAPANRAKSSISERKRKSAGVLLPEVACTLTIHHVRAAPGRTHLRKMLSRLSWKVRLLGRSPWVSHPKTESESVDRSPKPSPWVTASAE